MGECSISDCYRIVCGSLVQRKWSSHWLTGLAGLSLAEKQRVLNKEMWWYYPAGSEKCCGWKGCLCVYNNSVCMKGMTRHNLVSLSQTFSLTHTHTLKTLLLSPLHAHTYYSILRLIHCCTVQGPCWNTAIHIGRTFCTLWGIDLGPYPNLGSRLASYIKDNIVTCVTIQMTVQEEWCFWHIQTSNPVKGWSE